MRLRDKTKMTRKEYNIDHFARYLIKRCMADLRTAVKVSTLPRREAVLLVKKRKRLSAQQKMSEQTTSKLRREFRLP